MIRWPGHVEKKNWRSRFNSLRRAITPMSNVCDPYVRGFQRNYCCLSPEGRMERERGGVMYRRPKTCSICAMCPFFFFANSFCAGKVSIHSVHGNPRLTWTYVPARSCSRLVSKRRYVLSLSVVFLGSESLMLVIGLVVECSVVRRGMTLTSLVIRADVVRGGLITRPGSWTGIISRK